MMRIRNYFIIFASVFAITAGCALVGMQDVKAAESAMSDLIKRIEALESKPSGGNVVAPKINGLKMGFEIRHRFEFRSNPKGDSGLGGSPDKDFTLQRTRIYLDADVNRNVRGYIKLQDARTFGAEGGTTGNLSRVDLLEGFVELRNLGDFTSLLKDVDVRVGRWQQWYGNHRWFGHLNWANESRSYDGLRVRFDNKKNAWVDLWAYQINEDQTGGVSGEVPSTVIGTGKAQDELFWGIYAGFKPIEGLTVEPYLAIRNRSRDANGSRTGTAIPGEQRYHFGARLVGKNIPALPGVDFTFEQAWQRGKTESAVGFVNPVVAGAGNYRSQDIQAYGGAYQVGYTFKSLPWTPRVGYGYVFASGDSKAGDGKSRTFSHLYPTGHATMGYIDYHAWQNIRDHQGHLTLKPSKKLLLKVDYHKFSAAERLDDWYTVGGAGRGQGGASTSDRYGDELDITAKYKLLKNFSVVAGYSKYWTGKFIRDSNVGSQGDVDWFYLQTTMKF